VNVAKFPSRELEITRLAEDVAKGLRANGDAFPAPPVSPEAIDQALEDYNTARDAAIAASAHAADGTKAKEKALDALAELVKTDLRYAETTTSLDAAKLRLLGWGGRRARSANEVPGQVITLEVIKEGKTWIQLGWKEPFDGGKVGAYTVQRRNRSGGEWSVVGSSMQTGITLDDQDGGVECEYRVIAVNKAGEGPASNIVTSIP
jgi:hypothetical protein